MVEDKIFNSSWNSTDYDDNPGQQSILLDPIYEGQNEDNLSDDMEEVYAKKRLHEEMEAIYEKSDYYEKYGVSDKKVDRSDLFGIYYDFKEALLEKEEYSLLQIFCEIIDFFDLTPNNIKTMFNEILTLEDKVAILDLLSEKYGLSKQFAKAKRLF